MAIKFLFILLLAAHQLSAQQGVFSVRPVLGLQTPLSKKLYSGYTKANLVNNAVEEEILYAFGLEYEIAGARIFSLQYMNGNSGYSIKLKHKACNNLYSSGLAGNERASAGFFNKRLIAGFQFPLTGRMRYKRKCLTTSVKLGLGIDLESKENSEGNFVFPGRNLCNEVYYLADTIIYRSKTSWILPFQLNVDWYHKQKKRIQLSLFLHLGLSKNVVFDVDYVNVTLGNREKATFLSRGSGYGVVLSYPIRVYRLKKNV